MAHPILETLKPTQMVHLATCENGQPRLRPMTLICKDGRLFFATGSTDSKSSQIAVNPQAEFCLLLQSATNSGYLRGSGRLLQIEDISLRKEIADFATFIYDYWQDPADPGYRLYELELKQLRLMQPGEMTEQLTEL